MKEDINKILSKPYERVLIPDAEIGGYTALIKEFPGCVDEGDTAEEALKNLEKTAVGWLELALERDLDIPLPSSELKYSGRYALRLSTRLHQKAAEFAKDEAISLNQFIVNAVSEKVGALSFKLVYVNEITNHLSYLTRATSNLNYKRIFTSDSAQSCKDIIGYNLNQTSLDSAEIFTIVDTANSEPSAITNLVEQLHHTRQ